MLTAGQIDALREDARKITDPVTAYLLRDIARRIAQAGELTSTAAYQVWRAQQLGLSQREIQQKLRQLLQASQEELERILYQSVQSGYDLDVRRFSTVEAVPFERNAVLQQIVSAAVELAREDLSNIAQTIGFVTPHGRVEPLTRAYVTSCDFTFQQVITGAASYTEAIRQATRFLADKGIRVIDYDSGVHTSLEAAVRRNILGGLGLMQEKVSQQVHDDLGCDGWEITAHAMSAPDHEPIQGKQYSDAAYTALNNSLRRRIGTLNCGHAAFPIILGVNSPQYTPAELEKFRTDNEKGVTVDGVHYTGYEATQMQRGLERAIRRQKDRIMVDEGAGDKERLAQDKARLEMLHQRYREFSKAAGLRTQYERTEVEGFGEKYGVANSTRSGIMGTTTLKEIPEMKTAQTPRLPARMTVEDVTEEYRRTAAPGQGTVTYEDGYKVKNHQDEIKIAEWLHKTFGGDIKLLKEAAGDSVKRPDYMWKDALWELKGSSSVSGADKRFQYAIKQIKDNPGGVILDILENIDMAALERQLDRRFSRKESEINSLDLMLLQKGEVIKILRYKK